MRRIRPRVGMHTDKHSTANNGSYASAKSAIQYHRQRLVDNHIGQEQRDQNPVFSPVQQLEDSFRVLMMGFGWIA